MADAPGPDAVARRVPVELSRRVRPCASVYGGVALAIALVGAWLLVGPRTPDLAAQVYRASLFGRLGPALYDEHWYAGHQLLGYSLLFPPLGAALGVRAVGALCAPLSSALFATLLREAYGGRGARGARWATAAFAVAAVGDVWLGRVSFALGVPFALAAALAYARGRRLRAVVLAALCAAASPVAGLLLGLAALTLALHRRSPRALLALALPAGLVVLPLNALFPEGGSEPFPTLSFLATAAVTVGFLVALPRREGLLRTGAVVYLLACAGCLLVSSPIGSNIERYAVLLAGPLLLCALLRDDGGARRVGAVRRGLGVVVLGAIGLWVLWGPVRETSAVYGDPATSASYYAPLERFLAGVPGPVRVEVPLTRTHWEAALLAPRVSLARGWDKQLDERYDGVLLGSHLDARGYRAWLSREGVSYVALADVALDPSSAAEGSLIRAGLPYLRLVFVGAHWRVYRVLGASGVLSGAGRLVSLGHDSFSLYARSAGSFLVRVHYSRYWTLTSGRGCVGPGAQGFTAVRAAAPGRIVVATRFSLSRAFGGGGAVCRGG